MNLQVSQRILIDVAVRVLRNLRFRFVPCRNLSFHMVMRPGDAETGTYKAAEWCSLRHFSSFKAVDMKFHAADPQFSLF